MSDILHGREQRELGTVWIADSKLQFSNTEMLVHAADPASQSMWDEVYYNALHNTQVYAVLLVSQKHWVVKVPSPPPVQHVSPIYLLVEAAQRQNWDQTFSFVLETILELGVMGVSPIYGKYVVCKLSYKISTMLFKGHLSFGTDGKGKEICNWMKENLHEVPFIFQVPATFQNVYGKIYKNSDAAFFRMKIRQSEDHLVLVGKSKLVFDLLVVWTWDLQEIIQELCKLYPDPAILSAVNATVSIDCLHDYLQEIIDVSSSRHKEY
uniref:Uncharacterized protein n=1 Tax=Moniliophthora roreri TaxID=221103 RepID=A0A0W0FTJ9_MONRR